MKVINKIYYLIVVGITVLCLIWNSGYALSKTETKLPLILLIITFLLLLFQRMGVAIKRNKFIISNSIIYFLLLAIGLGASLVANYSESNFSSTVVFFITIATAILIIKSIDFDIFAYWYVRIMMYMTIISFAALLFIKVFGTNYFPIFTNYNGVNYYNGYVFFFMYDYQEVLDRCMGIFWEPGVFASYLIFAIILENYFIKEEKRETFKSTIILSIGILLTQSSAGIMLLVIVLCSMLIKNNNRNKIIILCILSLILLTCFIFRKEIEYFLLNSN